MEWFFVPPWRADVFLFGKLLTCLTRLLIESLDKLTISLFVFVSPVYSSFIVSTRFQAN